MFGVLKTIQAFLFEKTLSRYAKSLPREFLLKEGNIDKNSLNFNLYKKLLLEYIKTIEQLQTEGPAVIEKIQIIKVRKVIKLASRTKWWGKYFQKNAIIPKHIHTLNEFRNIPPVTRREFADISKKDLLLVPETDPSLIWRGSSGSTSGVPMLWGLNKTILIVNVLANLLIQLEKRGFSFAANAHHNFHLHFNMFMTGRRHAFKWFSQPDFQASAEDSDYKERIFELNTTILNTKDLVLLAGPNELAPLIDSFKNLELQPHIPYVITVGSPLQNHIRQAVTTYFNSQIFSFYGAQEMGPCAIECRDTPDAYHVLSDRIILELLDEQGRSINENQPGLVTVTCLDNTVMPLIRYQPGDWGEFVSKKTCHCGNTFPLLKIIQRTTDRVHFSDGEPKSVLPILRLFNRAPYLSLVRRFQITQDKLDHLIIQLEVRDMLPEEAIIRLHKNIERIFKGKLKGEILQTQHINEGSLKFRVFIPLRNFKE